ncbi:MAG: ribosomal protein S18-alanine N-acetyltransferase [Betaproteobacteria bacterium]|nr:ribosomal protein S18-alanine N-acetyltransferase [Betaproteobacteria bacterium]
MTETLVIRMMEEGDLARVVELERELQHFPWSETHFRDSLGAGHYAWVVEAEGWPVAFAVVMLVVDEAHLLDIGVARDFQHQGIARRLLDHIYACVNEVGAVWILLEVRPSNEVALNVYERQGFSRIGRRKDYYPAAQGREDAIVMTKHLP